MPALVTSMYCLSVCAHDTDDTPGRWDGSTINAGGPAMPVTPIHRV